MTATMARARPAEEPALAARCAPAEDMRIVGSMSQHIIILGGGISGLSAAHELVERGFRVSVYEARAVVGGKARSIPVPGSGKDGRPDLPGEHGFRFFPRFYRHMPDTMKRIPYGNNRQGVFDNFTDTTRLGIARFDNRSLILPSRFPRTLQDLVLVIQNALFNFADDLKLWPGELEFFARRLWQILTSCEARRFDEYEKLSWWDFIDAQAHSPDYQKFLGIGLSRSLVAAQAQKANAKVEGEIILQLLFDLTTPGASSDRVLDGPTTDAWLAPWHRYLAGRGVEFHLCHELETIACEGRRVRSVTVRDKGSGERREVTGDHYVVALPVEALGALLDMSKNPQNQSVLDGDPTLASVPTLDEYVQWMNGVQYFLKKDVPISHGHVMFLDSPWALTAISEQQFWPHTPLQTYGDGQVNGVLSVCISDWESPGVLYPNPATGKNKTAMECTREEIMNDVWAQLQLSLNVDGKQVLLDENLHSRFLDPDITERLGASGEPAVTLENAEPLFVAYINTWELRPDAHTRIHNLFLAGDFVRTNTQLATMEAANESARRAVNCIIDAAGVSKPYCKIWSLHEPEVLALWHLYDAYRYERGLPWAAEFPAFIQLPQRAVIRTFETVRRASETVAPAHK
jgi:15-cis-phytoene desaturase